MKYRSTTRLYSFLALLFTGYSLLAQPPSDWTEPTPAAYAQQMNTTAVVVFDGVATGDPNDRVAYFIDDEFRNLTVVQQLPAAVFPQEIVHFSTIYGNGNQGSTVTVMVFHAATNAVYEAGTFTYFRDTQRGTIANPDTLAISSGVSLPVELTDFYARRDADNRAVVGWETAVEQDFSHYELERQMTTSTFQVIHRQPGGQARYTYVDRELPSAVDGLYRLRMVDLDGTFDYSSIISLGKTDGRYNAEGYVYPNPVGRGAAIQLAELVNTYDKRVVLYNTACGRFSITIDDGRLVLPATLPSGIYYVQYGEGAQVYQTRLVVN